MERFRSQCVDMMPRSFVFGKSLCFLFSCSVPVPVVTSIAQFPSESSLFAVISTRAAVDDDENAIAAMEPARATRMVFMFTGRVNMRASPRTGGAFFPRLISPCAAARAGVGVGEKVG